MSSKTRPPRPKGHNYRFREHAADAVRDLLLSVSLQDKDAFQESCLTCSYFREAEERCTKFNARPPARVIAYGCDQYIDNDVIPF